MSEIKKALQKARKRKTPELDMRDGKVAQRRHESPDSSSFQAISPVYSQTRSVHIDHSKLIDKKVFSIIEKNEVADQYKLLRTKILNRTRPLGHNTIEITSFREGDGKSLTSVNLAIILAKETRQSVLLADFDLRRPSIHTFFGLDAKPGLRDHFLHDVPIEDILVHPGIERLTVLPAGGRMDNSTEVMGSHVTEQLIQELKQRYKDRYIIFDTPALGTCSDPLVLSSYLDALVLVVRAGHTTTEDITAGMELIGDANVLGVVLNESQAMRGWAY